jgi:hypothetical protein
MSKKQIPGFDAGRMGTARSIPSVPSSGGRDEKVSLIEWMSPRMEESSLNKSNMAVMYNSGEL